MSTNVDTVRPTYPVYRYAYTATVGRIGEPLKDVLIGEVTSISRHLVYGIARKQVRKAVGLYPRTIKVSEAQFVRMTQAGKRLSDS